MNAARNASRERIAATRERVANLYYPTATYGLVSCPLCDYVGPTEVTLRRHHRRQHPEAS